MEKKKGKNNLIANFGGLLSNVGHLISDYDSRVKRCNFHTT